MRALLVILMLIAVTAGASYATYSRMGAQGMENPQGISIREESKRAGRGHFFLFYYSSLGSRSHRGGGLRGGK